MYGHNVLTKQEAFSDENPDIVLRDESYWPIHMMHRRLRDLLMTLTVTNYESWGDDGWTAEYREDWLPFLWNWSETFKYRTTEEAQPSLLRTQLRAWIVDYCTITMWLKNPPVALPGEDETGANGAFVGHNIPPPDLGVDGNPEVPPIPALENSLGVTMEDIDDKEALRREIEQAQEVDQDGFQAVRRSDRLRDQPRVGLNLFEEHTEENNRQWGELVRKYMAEIERYLPVSRLKFLEPIVSRVREDEYIGDFEATVYPPHLHMLGPPQRYLEIGYDERVTVALGLQWLCEKVNDPYQVQYFKAIACVVMFKDIMRIVCHMGVALPDWLWQYGVVEEQEEEHITEGRAKAMVLFDNWVTDWPTGFTNRPTNLPFRVTTNFNEVATFRFDAYVDAYTTLAAHLEEFQREFETMGKIVHIGIFDDEDFKENDPQFEAFAQGPDHYLGYKREIKERVNDLARKQAVDPQYIEFLNSAPPSFVPPIVINVPAPPAPPAPVQVQESGGNWGLIGGGLFTLWLLANMN